jgi:hypothetical protein
MITIDIKQFPEFAKNTMKDIRQKIISRLYKAAQLTRSALIAERIPSIKPFPPVDTGNYKMSWKAEKTQNGARMWSEAPYAGILELGVKPGRIPMPLKKARKNGWILVPASWALNWTYRKFRVKNKWRDRRDAYGMAIRVQMALSQRGIAARKVTTAPEWHDRVKTITVNALRG